MGNRSSHDKDEMVSTCTAWATPVTNPAEAQTIQTLDTSGGDGQIIGVAVVWTGTLPTMLNLIHADGRAYPLPVGAVSGIVIPIIGRFDYVQNDVITVKAAAAGVGKLTTAVVYSAA